MKITAVETVLVPEFPNIVFVRIHTSDGLIGLGETFWGRRSVDAWIHETAAPYLIGKDPLQIRKHWSALRGFVGFQGSGAENRGRSAIDLALWDILAQVSGVPLYQLLGGASRDRIRAYNTSAGPTYARYPPRGGGIGADNWNPPTSTSPYDDLTASMTDAGALALSLLEEGTDAMKIWPFDPIAERTGGREISPADLRTALRPFEQIRSAVGDRMQLMVDFHSLWDLPTALQIARALEPYDVYWFEDPVRMDSYEAVRRFADQTPVRVAVSETLATRWAFRDLINTGAASVVMFDPGWSGGITECVGIASLAEIAELPVAPHDCLGPVQFMAAVHLAIALPNALIQETVRAFWSGWYRDLVTTVPEVIGGYVSAPVGAGLGTELHPELLSRSDITINRSH